jgi:hypothetical protein
VATAAAHRSGWRRCTLGGSGRGRRVDDCVDERVAGLPALRHPPPHFLSGLHLQLQAALARAAAPAAGARVVVFGASLYECRRRWGMGWDRAPRLLRCGLDRYS